MTEGGYIYCVGGGYFLTTVCYASVASIQSSSSPSSCSPTSSSGSSTLTVNTQNTNGQTITGYYTVLYGQSGSIAATEFSPAAFVLNDGQSYSVQVDDYGSCHFNHWQDTGSTNPQRPISISSDAIFHYVLTAIYSCVTSTISVSTITSAGTQLTGYYTTLSLSDGTFLQSCFAPCSFTVDSGQNYVITVANYNGETFMDWSDGDGFVYAWGGSHYVAVPDGGTSTTVSLTAVYSP